LEMLNLVNLAKLSLPSQWIEFAFGIRFEAP
jgi:hypothetical protein